MRTENPEVEVIVAFSHFSVGQRFRPNGVLRDNLIARGLVKLVKKTMEHKIFDKPETKNKHKDTVNLRDDKTRIEDIKFTGFKS